MADAIVIYVALVLTADGLVLGFVGVVLLVNAAEGRWVRRRTRKARNHPAARRRT